MAESLGVRGTPIGPERISVIVLLNAQSGLGAGLLASPSAESTRTNASGELGTSA